MTSLSYSSYPRLPARPALYAVWAGNKILYIGQAQNLNIRFFGHERHCDFEGAGATLISWTIIPDKAKRLQIERLKIAKMNPPLNRKNTNQIAVPFNLRGEDAELANRVRDHFERKLSTRLSAVQVARIVYAQVAQIEGV